MLALLWLVNYIYLLLVDFTIGPLHFGQQHVIVRVSLVPVEIRSRYIMIQRGLIGSIVEYVAERVCGLVFDPSLVCKLVLKFGDFSTSLHTR